MNHTECELIIIEHEKMLIKLLELLPELPHAKRILSVENREKYKKLDDIEGKLQGRELIFLSDALKKGQEIIDEKGTGFLREKGESIASTDLVTIIYTSGTTGAPKGVMLEHGSFCFNAKAFSDYVTVPKEERTLIFLPPWHIAERVLELCSIARGVALAPTNISALAKDLMAIRPTFLLSVPRVWEQLHKRIVDGIRKQSSMVQTLFNTSLSIAFWYTDLKDVLLNRFAFLKAPSLLSRVASKLKALVLFPFAFLCNLPAQLILGKVRAGLGGKLQYAISGASALNEQSALFFRACGIPIVEVYGMTETTASGAASAFRWQVRGALGKPLSGCKIEIRDEAGNPVTTPGERGVLWHQGPHLMRGYYREPEKTAQSMKDGWFNSGDIFAWTTTGEVKYTGRAKDTIVLANGENLEPEPIELKLRETPFIGQCMVVGQDQKTLGVLLVPNWERCHEEFSTLGLQAPDNKESWNDATKIRKFFADLIKSEISTGNGFKSFEKVTGFHIMHKEFEAGKEMTQTLKIRRNIVYEIYEKEIKGIYSN